jgi:tRNA (cytidine/uridine-2'-O-)-methyltransferase
MAGLGIALYKPLIPPNTGNIARLSVALECDLYIVGKTPIKWDEPALKRAGLDHWDKVRLTHFARFKDFYLKHKNRRIIAITKESSNIHWDFKFLPDDILLFGNETSGLPPALIKLAGESTRIPMWGEGVRSLNLSNSAAIVAYEYCRQMADSGLLGKNGVSFKRTYYKSSCHEKLK